MEKELQLPMKTLLCISALWKTHKSEMKVNSSIVSLFLRSILGQLSFLYLLKALKKLRLRKEDMESLGSIERKH